MADHHASHAVDNDYNEHEKTYLRFIGLAKWGTVFCIVLLMIFGSATSLVPWALTLLVGAALVLGAIFF